MSSESRKLTHQKKQFKTELLLNQTFSPKNIWSRSHQNFSTIWFALNNWYAILYPKGMGYGILAIYKINELFFKCFHGIYMSQIHRMFMACAVLTEAIFPFFNLKPDHCNLATIILAQRHSHLLKHSYWENW